MEAPPMLTTPNANQKIWSMLSHISGLIGVGLILPLVVYLAQKNESPYVTENAREALNFHLSLAIYGICCIPLIAIFVGVPLLILLGLAGVILSIVAAIRASHGESYRYPLTIRLVR